jgi:hypothetical protein
VPTSASHAQSLARTKDTLVDGKLLCKFAPRSAE